MENRGLHRLMEALFSHFEDNGDLLWKLLDFKELIRNDGVYETWGCLGTARRFGKGLFAAAREPTSGP